MLLYKICFNVLLWDFLLSTWVTFGINNGVGLVGQYHIVKDYSAVQTNHQMTSRVVFERSGHACHSWEYPGRES